jgi:hypothetical protein
MSEPELANHLGDRATPSPKASFWLRELPYIVVLVLTLIGIGVTTVSRSPPMGFFEFMALVLCIVVIASAWAETKGRNARFRLILTQVLHWTSFLVAMNLTLLPSVQRLLNPEATGIAVLLLLALGAVTAGINILSWQISFIGVVLAVSVPLKAWLQQGAVIIVLGLIVAMVGLGIVYSWHRNADRKASAPLVEKPSDTD